MSYFPALCNVPTHWRNDASSLTYWSNRSYWLFVQWSAWTGGWGIILSGLCCLHLFITLSHLAGLFSPSFWRLGWRALTRCNFFFPPSQVLSVVHFRSPFFFLTLPEFAVLHNLSKLPSSSAHYISWVHTPPVWSHVSSLSEVFVGGDAGYIRSLEWFTRFCEWMFVLRQKIATWLSGSFPRTKLLGVFSFYQSLFLRNPFSAIK